MLEQKAVNLATVPLTLVASRYHFYRVYLQEEQRLSNDSLKPEDWGRDGRDILVPKQLRKNLL